MGRTWVERLMVAFAKKTTELIQSLCQTSLENTLLIVFLVGLQLTYRTVVLRSSYYSSSNQHWAQWLKWKRLSWKNILKQRLEHRTNMSKL